jgi:DNA-binding NarL/FixJ family response regulator
VLTILNGGLWISPQLNARVVNRRLRRNTAGRAQAASTAAVLSPRELQVLDLLRSGKTTKQIAGTLHLSTRTVDIHRANMKKKLGLRTGAELIAFASKRP